MTEISGHHEVETSRERAAKLVIDLSRYGTTVSSLTDYQRTLWENAIAAALDQERRKASETAPWEREAEEALRRCLFLINSVTYSPTQRAEMMEQIRKVLAGSPGARSVWDEVRAEVDNPTVPSERYRGPKQSAEARLSGIDDELRVGLGIIRSTKTQCGYSWYSLAFLRLLLAERDEEIAAYRAALPRIKTWGAECTCHLYVNPHDESFRMPPSEGCVVHGRLGEGPE